jgi:ubiquitin carboxyl-terminal hydrolase 36/42
MVQNMQRVGEQFQMYQQEDAHEYLVRLLDTMHEELLRANGLKLSDGKITETTAISRIFGGTFCNELRCTSCPYVSTT